MTFRLPPLVSLLGCLLALTLGCYAPMATPNAAYYPEGGMAYAEDGLYTEAPADYAVEESGSRGRSAGKSSKKDSNYRADKAEKEAYAPSEDPAAPAPTLADEVSKTPDAQPPEEPTDDDHDDRQIIYTASLQLAVYELDQTMAFAEDIPRRHGGWIQARYDYQITLRVPADHLQAIIAELSELGDVLGKTLQADDVTAQYTDLASRIAVLEQLVVQLELLLKQAKTVEDSLKVRQELERVRIELESAKAQMRQLAESISFSTLTLVLSARGPVDTLPSSNDPFPWVDELGVESTEYR